MAKYDGRSVTLSIDAVTVGQVRDISGPGLSRDTIDVTSRDSTADWREFIKGLKDGGEVSFDIVYDPDTATHSALTDDFDSDTLSAFVVTFPDTIPTTWTFDGIITAFEPKAPMDGELSADVTIKVSGQPVIA